MIELNIINSFQNILEYEVEDEHFRTLDIVYWLIGRVRTRATAPQSSLCFYDRDWTPLRCLAMNYVAQYNAMPHNAALGCIQLYYVAQYTHTMPKCVYSTFQCCITPHWTASCKIQLRPEHVQLLVLFNYTLAAPLHCKLYLCTHGYVFAHPLQGTL